MSYKRIYLFENGKSQKITGYEDEYTIRVQENNEFLPMYFENLVKEKWQNDIKSNIEIYDSLIAYFYSYNMDDRADFVFFDSYKYQNCFGKDSEFTKYETVALDYNKLALSSICIIITKDHNLIVGNKKNMDNKKSGFSGYLNAKYVEGDRVNVYNYIIDSICLELNIQSKNITSIIRIGQSYSPDIIDDFNKQSTRVYNNQYIVNVNLTTDEIVNAFKVNTQFDEIEVIRNKYNYIYEFLKNNINNLSIHFYACLYNYVYMNFGIDLNMYFSDVKVIDLSVYKIGVNNISNLVRSEVV